MLTRKGLIMNKKIYCFLILLVLFSIILTGCEASSQDMKSMSTESVIEDFLPFDKSLLESRFTRNKIERYLLELNPSLNVKAGHYAIGDLTGDEIPEIAMYIERHPEKIDDPGYLVIYGYDLSSYKVLDTVSMNYDNTNYVLEIGNISKEQKGILLSNQVGSKAGVTYGYILDNKRLKSILNPKKVNLFSVSTSNSVLDIDNDGILEYSLYSIDPESNISEPSEENIIQLWYKWNGNDGADVKYIQDNNSLDNITAVNSSKITQSMNGSLDNPEPGSPDHTKYILENIEDFTASEITDMLEEHLMYLQINRHFESQNITNGFAKYKKENSLNLSFNEYNLLQKHLNDAKYLQRDKILEDKSDLKDMLIRNLNLGYFLVINNGEYVYDINYSKFLDNFCSNITNEFRKYLQIMSKATSTPHKTQDQLLIDKQILSDRIVEIENFRLTYGYSKHLDQVLKVYENYMNSILYLTEEGKVFNEETGTFFEKSNESLQKIVNNYPDTHMADVINQLLKKVKSNNNSITPSIREDISSMIP